MIIVRFEKGSELLDKMRYDFSKDISIGMAKSYGKMIGATLMTAEYSSGKHIGIWELKGSKWYKW